MFEIGWSEILVIAVVALIAIGPKELPGVLRMVGQWMGKIRRMASEFQGQFHEAMREAEMADLKKHVDDITTAARSITNYDPMDSLKSEIEKPVESPPAEHTSTEHTTAELPPAEHQPVEQPSIEHQPTEPIPAAPPVADVEPLHAPQTEVATSPEPAPAKAAGERS
jgi:sec-independent protein translocase protein TatB